MRVMCGDHIRRLQIPRRDQTGFQSKLEFKFNSNGSVPLSVDALLIVTCSLGASDRVVFLWSIGFGRIWVRRIAEPQQTEDTLDLVHLPLKH